MAPNPMSISMMCNALPVPPQSKVRTSKPATSHGLCDAPKVSEIWPTPISQARRRAHYTTDNVPEAIPSHVANRFPRFRDLPPELRQRIWTLMLPDTRFVPITYCPISHSPPSKAYGGCTSTSAVPSILQVNRESRIYAKSKYALSLNLMHAPPKIWFDYSVDVLYFARLNKRKRSSSGGIVESFRNFHNATSLIEPSELSKVKKLAVDVDLFDTRLLSSQGCHEEDPLFIQFWEIVRSKYRGLESVVFVMPGKTTSDATTLPRSGIFLPIEWLCKKELQGQIEDFNRRVDNASSVLREIDHASDRLARWRTPAWEVLALDTESKLR